MHIISSRATGAFELETENYGGYQFDHFYAARDTTRGPGWYVFGAEKYDRKADGKGAYVMLCARPNMPARKRFGYNGPVKRGWRLKREAMAVAVYLNTAAHGRETSDMSKIPDPEAFRAIVELIADLPYPYLAVLREAITKRCEQLSTPPEDSRKGERKTPR